VCTNGVKRLDVCEWLNAAVVSCEEEEEEEEEEESGDSGGK
jgi:hypothetical protein